MKPNKLYLNEAYFSKKSEKIDTTKNRRSRKRKENTEIFERKKPTKRRRNGFQAPKVEKEVKRQKENSLRASEQKLFEKLAEEKAINEKRLAMKKDMSFSNEKPLETKAGYSGETVTKQVIAYAAKYNKCAISNIPTTKNELSSSKTCLKEERKFEIEKEKPLKKENSFPITTSVINDQISSESSEEEEEDVEDNEWWKGKKEDKELSTEELVSGREIISMMYCSDSSDFEGGVVLEELSDDELDDN